METRKLLIIAFVSLLTCIHAYSITPQFNNENVNPKFDVKVTECKRIGKHVWITVLVTNNSGRDYNNVEIFNSWIKPQTTAVYDENGNSYEIGIVKSNEFHSPNLMDFLQIDFPDGVPVKTRIIAVNVPTNVKKIAKLQFGLKLSGNTPNDYNVVKDIEISEPSPNTNNDNVTCSYPYIKIIYLSCTRKGSAVEIKFRMTHQTDEDQRLEWKYDHFSAYDEEGESHEISVRMPNLSDERVLLPSQTPVLTTITIQNVPTSIKEISSIILPYRLTHYNTQFGYEIRLKNLRIQ